MAKGQGQKERRTTINDVLPIHIKQKFRTDINFGKIQLMAEAANMAKVVKGANNKNGIG